MNFNLFAIKIFSFSILLANLDVELKANSNPDVLNSNSSIKNEITVDYLNNIEENFYLLGPGDSLSISVSDDYPELEKIINVDIDGTINLPKLNKIYIEGLSIVELNNILNKAYLEFVKYPLVTTSMINYRPINVVIAGEANSTGLQTLDGVVFGTTERTPYFPTVYDAIKSAGGFTRNANISKIEVIRKNSFSKGGGLIKTNLDFREVFAGRANNNIRIYDGDLIKISKSDHQDSILSNKNLSTNINEKEISVYIAGRSVGNGQNGKLLVPNTSSMNEAIMIANGKKVISGSITFVRFNKDGNTLKRKINYASNAKPGSLNNPYLQSNDLIFIGNNLWNNSNEIIQEVTSPFSSILSVYGLFKIFND